MKSLDTECTGLDIRFGAKPFFVTICTSADEVLFWEFDVDPETREPQVPEADLDEIACELNPYNNENEEDGDGWGWRVLQNAKFDVKALSRLRKEFAEDWDWSKTHETLISGHLLASNQPHDLTTMALVSLGVNISPYEKALEKATKEARRIAASRYPTWRIAKKGLPEMPSAKETVWKYDSWLPRAIAKAEGYPPDHPWWTVLRDYANTDSSVTLPLHKAHMKDLERRGLTKIYYERLKILPIVYAMEDRGITLNRDRLEKTYKQYSEESEACHARCLEAADWEIDKLPVQGTSNALKYVLLDKFKLLSNKTTKKGNDSLDKSVLEHWSVTLPEGSKPHTFVTNLRDYRRRRTAMTYMEGYKKFWFPWKGDEDAEIGFKSDSIRNQGSQEVSTESPKESGVLDLGSRKVLKRVRSIPCSGRDESPSNKLHSPQGKNTIGDSGSSSLRQPSVCESRPSVPGNSSRQYERHDTEGTRRQSEGNETSGGQNNRSGRSKHKEVIRIGSSASRVMQDVQFESSANLRNRTSKILETSLDDWRVLHPSLNPTGTDTLRWSSSQPNEQNISKQEGFNLRAMFGPAPGREWWSCDAQNIELRIPAYEAGELEMIDIFERPDDPPYFGSYHLLVFDTLHPEKFAKHGKKCKEIYESTWYQWTKNGNFAVGYGSVESSGTADRAYHVPGAFARIKGRFSKIHGPGGLNDQMIKHAERYGYVETIPDKTVDPTRGYPLLCTRTNHGRILPTVPLNYHVQGSAMWWMMKAMIRCQEYLNRVNTEESGGYYLIIQVHDELVFDFPAPPTSWRQEPWKYNLRHVRQCMRLMRQGGDDIGLPTPVSCKYHATTWAEGLAV